MEMIKKLSEMIEEELEDAEKYARCALNNKEDFKSVADVFYELGNAEMEHMNKLHGQVVNIIENYRKEHGEPPEKMKFLYDYLHEKHMKKAAEIKIMLSMYKG